LSQDYPIVQGSVLVIAITVLLANLIVDLSYGWLDPGYGMNNRGRTMMKKEPELPDTVKTRSSGNEFRRMLRIFLSRRIVILGFAIILILLIGLFSLPFWRHTIPMNRTLKRH